MPDAALEVHRPIIVDEPGLQQSLPVLPPYVLREHDARLAEVGGRAAAGYSGMAVLVGGSSTGKTRACWEALAPLREQGGWRLWHPFDPTRPEATLANLSRVGPKTVIWLNETQFYLDTPTEVGERVAAALRNLLTKTDQTPVLVLGTLWPQHWDVLTSPTTHNLNAQARALLTGRRIHVRVAFTESDLEALFDAGRGIRS